MSIRDITSISTAVPGATYTVSASNNPYSLSGVSPLPTGTSGQVLISGTNGLSYTGGYTTPYYQTSINTVSANTTPNKITFPSDAEFHGKLTVGGKDISELLEKIEERLAILHPNVELEDKWKDLKALGEQYRELEKEIIEKEKMWEILNR